MRIRFTKMHGAGNDFVVLDETAGLLGLSAAQYRWLADRHMGVGADQILSVRAAPHPGVDFEYVIHNADGGQVEQCGNGARCFVRFVRGQGLTDKRTVSVQVGQRVIALTEQADGRVSVDMGVPEFALPRVPFDSTAALPGPVVAGWAQWRLSLKSGDTPPPAVQVAVLSMGNPHAVMRVDDVDAAPVVPWGALIERHAAFPQQVNAGFMQVLGRSQVRLRVYERGVGETLACGTGACAAAVAGMRLGLLDDWVDVATRGGRLTIAWRGGMDDAVFMTGPATRVFDAEVEIPEL